MNTITIFIYLYNNLYCLLLSLLGQVNQNNTQQQTSEDAIDINF